MSLRPDDRLCFSYPIKPLQRYYTHFTKGESLALSLTRDSFPPEVSSKIRSYLLASKIQDVTNRILEIKQELKDFYLVIHEIYHVPLITPEQRCDNWIRAYNRRLRDLHLLAQLEEGEYHMKKANRIEAVEPIRVKISRLLSTD